MSITKTSWGLINTQTVSAANISDKTSAINTVNKYEGLYIWDSTNHRMMRSEGPLDVDKWYVVDGSTSVTPS